MAAYTLEMKNSAKSNEIPVCFFALNLPVAIQVSKFRNHEFYIY